MSFKSIGEIAALAGHLAQQKADLFVLPLSKESRGVPPEILGLLGGAEGPLAAALGSGDFQGDPGEIAIIYGTGSHAPRVLLLGLGPGADVTRERIRSAAAAAARRVRDLGLGQVLVPIPLAAGLRLSAEEQAELAAEGMLLGAYRFAEFKTVEVEKFKSVRKVTLLLPPGEHENALRRAIERGRVRAEGTNYARDLANTPANILTPTRLGALAETMAAEEKLAVEVWDRDRCEKEGMGAFLGVARGSEEPPKFITLRYSCGRPDAPVIGLVGKGITFDAGGISLKPPLNMHEMKFDMCGAAAVLGTMKSLRPLGVAVDVVAAIPATENLPSGKATKPGDVHRSYHGKTIEVLNTDAEGRLVLADALSWVARNHKPAVLVDLATLTGAVLIALGHYGAAVLSNNDDLVKRLQAASERSGDLTWRLPIWDDYPEHLKGETADLRNIVESTVGAGTIAGGAFLREFVDGTPWAHIDIAGTAYWDKDRPHLPKGPSGYGVRLLLDLLEGYAR